MHKYDTQKSLWLTDDTQKYSRETAVGRAGSFTELTAIMQHLFIEADNLIALRYLSEQGEWAGRLRMIYIDPPYNSGKELVYADSFAGEAWVDMLRARLELARGLLADNGAIFISIDDGELVRLRCLCNEVFGAENFVCCFNWQTTRGAQGMQRRAMVVANHEYILVYARNAERFAFLGEERGMEGFANPDGDPRGPWKRQYVQRKGQGLPLRRLVNPESGLRFSCESPYSQEKLDSWVAEGRIIFPKSPKQYPARKEFLYEYTRQRQLTTSLGLHSTKASTEQLYALFGGVKIFTNPKPLSLLSYLIRVTCAPQDTVLDFFAGSGTTAQALLQVNAEDGGRRRFVLVQNAEPCKPRSEAFKAGYATIAEICKERIRRACAGVSAGGGAGSALAEGGAGVPADSYLTAACKCIRL